MNRKILTGATATLQSEPHKKSGVYPKEIEDLAEECWLTKATTPEPNKHQRPECAPKDEGGETIPHLLQTLTDDEAYCEFQKNYGEKIKTVMAGKCETIGDKHKTDTTYNKKVRKNLEKMREKFPSRNWFMQKKPPQTKINNDHTTGLCKDCHSAQVNYTTIFNYAKTNCVCKTANCPNWTCLCNGEEECTCFHNCGCDDCTQCQVTNKVV